MVYRGNLTFQSFECEYDEVYEAYDVDGDIKNDVQILADYYTYSGYYTFLNSSFWKSLFDCIYWEDITGREFSKTDFENLYSRFYEDMIPFSCNIKDIQERIDIFSQIITVQANLNEHALFNMVNVKELSLFEDFMKVFFNKQNKKVRKSFLHSHGFKYLDEYYNEGRRYDYFTMFKKYFGDKFSKFIDDELKKYGINEKFSAMNVVNSIFSKISKDQLLSIINRLNLNKESFNSFNPYLAFNGHDMIFVFMWDESKKHFDDLEVLWIDFLLNSGFDVEIFAFNKSNNSLSRFVNKFKENKIKLELFNLDENGQENFKLEKSDKLMIDDFRQLKNEINNLNNENVVIKLDEEEVIFDDIYDVFLCTSEKENNGLSKDYCCRYGDSNPSKFPCKYVEEYFSSIFNVTDGFGHITDDGIWKFNKDKVRDKLKDLSKTMKICPFFDYMSNKKSLTKYLKNINPKTMHQWCFVDEDGHSWYFLRKVWFSDEADLDFPGFSKMAGVKKTDENVKSKAVAILDDKLKKQKKSMKKDDTEQMRFDF